jgi:hypothetical protein
LDRIFNLVETDLFHLFLNTVLRHVSRRSFFVGIAIMSAGNGSCPAGNGLLYNDQFKRNMFSHEDVLQF